MNDSLVRTRRGSAKPLKKERKRRAPADARQALIGAMEMALDDMEFNTLTVHEVTRRADMTRSAFYHYFKNLDELVVALLEQFESEIRAAVDPMLEGRVDDAHYRVALGEHLRGMFEVFQQRHRSVGAVAQAASGNRTVFDRWQQRVIDYYIAKTSAFIHQQVALGRSQVADPERVARALILMNNAVGLNNMIASKPDEPAELARVIATIWNATIYGDET